MIAQARAWLRQRAETFVVGATITIVILIQVTGPIASFVLGLLLLFVMRIALRLGKR